jgi:protein TonB
MNTMTRQPFQSQLPWSSSDKENKLFSKITVAALVITIILALLVQWRELPEQTRQEKEKLPPQLTRIIEARKVEPPKPIEKPKPIPEVKKPETTPEVKKPEPVKPKPVEKKKPLEVKKPVPKPPTQAELAEKAREKAQQSGLLAFQDDIASMRSDMQINNQADTEMIQGAGQANQTQRKFVGKKVSGASGGLNTSNLTTDIGAKGELTGRKTTEFVAPNEGMASLAEKQLVTADEVVGSRDIESIRKVFGASKGAIYSVYRRALRQDPGLQGKVVVNLEIAPDGSVSNIKIVSSELDYPELENKLLARIRLVNFGAQNVTRTLLDYSFDFLPF